MPAHEHADALFRSSVTFRQSGSSFIFSRPDDDEGEADADAINLKRHMCDVFRTRVLNQRWGRANRWIDNLLCVLHGLLIPAHSNDNRQEDLIGLLFCGFGDKREPTDVA